MNRLKINSQVAYHPNFAKANIRDRILISILESSTML